MNLQAGEDRMVSHYEQMIARQRKWMLYFLVILVLGAGITPYKQIFLGLFLGSIASFYNLYLLQRKTKDFVESVAEKQSRGRTKGIGMLSRFAAAILAVFIAVRYEAYFHIIAVIIGIMTSYVVIIIDFILFHNKHESLRER